MPKDVELLENKIRQILRIMAINRVSHCVLGALGCGVFCNPPRKVAQAFRKVILEEEFVGCFEEIVFAVLDSKGSRNVQIFKEAIGDFEIKG